MLLHINIMSHSFVIYVVSYDKNHGFLIHPFLEVNIICNIILAIKSIVLKVIT